MDPDDLYLALKAIAEAPAPEGPETFAHALFRLVPGVTERRAAVHLIALGSEAPVDFPVRADLSETGNDPNWYWLLLEGSVDEWISEFRMSTRHAGDLIGELNALVRTHDHVSKLDAHARTPVCAVRMRVEHLRAAVAEHAGFARAVLAAVAGLTSAYADDEGQFNEALDDYFPHGDGQLTPGPYVVGHARLHLWWCRTRARADGHTTHDPIDAQLPPGVRRIPLGGAFLLAVAQMHDVKHPFIERKSFNYEETGIFCPVQIGLDPRPRMHVPFMYPDNNMAIYLGREIAGLPKLRASNFFEHLSDDTHRFLMRRVGREELDIRYRRFPREARSARGVLDILRGVAAAAGSRDAADTLLLDLHDALIRHRDGAPRWPFNRVNTSTWKRIFAPSASYAEAHGRRKPWSPQDFQVDAVCETPFNVRRVHDLSLLKLTEDIFADTHFAMGPIQSSSRYGLYLDLEVEMAAGRVLIDYLRQPSFARSGLLDWAPPRTI